LDGFGFATMVVVGFTACVEFGSYAFVHPVIRRLPAREHIVVEQGLLRTFGRIMPVLMPVSVILMLIWTLLLDSDAGTARPVAWVGFAFLAAAVLITLIVNVPINAATGRWDAENPPADWREIRRRWELFQGVRSWLLLGGFVWLCLAVALQF